MASMVPFLFRASIIQDRGGGTSRGILLILNKFLVAAPVHTMVTRAIIAGRYKISLTVSAFLC